MNSISAAQSTLRQAKRALRKQMGDQLDALSSSTITTQSDQITFRTLNHSAFRKADKVSIYVSMEKGEVKTEELCKQALSLGKRLYVPKFATIAAATFSSTKDSKSIKFDADMRMLRIYDWKDYEAMVMNKWGIREPHDDYNVNNREDGKTPDTKCDKESTNW